MPAGLGEPIVPPDGRLEHGPANRQHVLGAELFLHSDGSWHRCSKPHLRPVGLDDAAQLREVRQARAVDLPRHRLS